MRKRHGRESIRFANATTRIPYATGTVAALYSSHMIEHLDRREARSFLAEARRVLRPGGVLRLAALDLSRLIDQYLNSGDADAFLARTCLGLDRPAGLGSGPDGCSIGPRHHRWNGPTARHSLACCGTGFVDVAVEPPGVTRIVDPGAP